MSLHPPLSLASSHSHCLCEGFFNTCALVYECACACACVWSLSRRASLQSLCHWSNVLVLVKRAVTSQNQVELSLLVSLTRCLSSLSLSLSLSVTLTIALFLPPSLPPSLLSSLSLPLSLSATRWRRNAIYFLSPGLIFSTLGPEVCVRACVSSFPLTHACTHARTHTHSWDTARGQGAIQVA